MAAKRQTQNCETQSQTPKAKRRKKVTDDASLLTFGVQVLGPAGSRVWVDDAFVKIASNENNWGPPPAVMEAMQHAFKYANRYGNPDGNIMQVIADPSIIIAPLVQGVIDRLQALPATARAYVQDKANESVGGAGPAPAMSLGAKAAPVPAPAATAAGAL